jgi:hypothetical protein
MTSQLGSFVQEKTSFMFAVNSSSSFHKTLSFTSCANFFENLLYTKSSLFSCFALYQL